MPDQYTPRHLGQRILAARESLIGERKQVTVLFADVVGSTELIRDRDPEEAQQLLDGVVHVMMDAVHRYEGTVSRLMGDGLMAMFGAPLAHEDHAVRACYAALALLEGARRHTEQVRRTYGISVAVRVGVSSGEVVVRTIRDDLHMDYTAMGQTVHLASRLEGLAEPGTAVLSAETLALAEGYVQVRALGPVPVKGLDRPVELYGLLGAGQARTRLQAAAARGLTRFVGRDNELAALYRALELAQTGHGQLVALVGEPGVGKSRLVWEVTHSHRTQEWLVLESGSVSYGKATSYLPVIDLLNAYCRIETVDDARVIREKVTGKLLTLDRALEPCLPALLALLDVPVEDAGWQALDPTQRRRQTLDAVQRLLLRESQEQPLLLVFEDLHWIDSETQALLDSLVERLPAARVFLLVNYRPEYSHTWGSKTYYSQLRIDPLGEASADGLLASLLGDDPSVTPLTGLLTARTEGNPLFLEESVRSLVEIGALAGERGAYRLVSPVTSLRVPATVQAVLAARIDRLPAAEKALLQTAAVIGKDVPDVLLRAIADRTEDELQAELARLQAAEFVYQAWLFPELEYTFKHALTHEVAYGSLLQDRRKTLHARVVSAIEAAYPDRLVEQVERLAHHSLRGELWKQAVQYARAAGLRALALSAGHRAVSHLKQALQALEQIPDSRARTESSVDIRFELRTALVSVDEHDQVYVQLREAEQLARSIDDQRRIGWATTFLAHYMRATVDHHRAISLGEEAIDVATQLSDETMRLMALNVVAQCSHELGQYQHVIELVRPMVFSLAGKSDYQQGWQHVATAVSMRGALAFCLAWRGDFDEATVHVEDSLHIAQQIRHQQTIESANTNAGLVSALRGHIPLAIEQLERSVKMAVERGGQPHPSRRAFLGHAYVLAGRAEDAVAELEQALTRAAEIGHFACLSLWTEWMAGAYLLAGRHADARRTANSALSIADRYDERGFIGYSLRALGEIAASTDPPDADEAAARYREALATAEELGMRPLQAHCHLGLGKLYRRAGHLDEARAELTTAIAMLREMGMTFWLPEAERELAQAAGSPSEVQKGTD